MSGMVEQQIIRTHQKPRRVLHECYPTLLIDFSWAYQTRVGVIMLLTHSTRNTQYVKSKHILKACKFTISM